MQTINQNNQNVMRLVTLNSAFLERVQTMKQYETAMEAGAPVILSSNDRSLEIYPVAYEYANQPINDEIEMAGEWMHGYRTALRNRRKVAAAEWLDDLEVLAMHTPYDIVRKLIENWLSAVEVPRRWRAN